jgi:hypothetical protein
MSYVARALSPATPGSEELPAFCANLFPGGNVIRNKSRLLTAVGSLALALSLILRLWTHGNSSHFATGFLLGMSIALLLFAVAKKSRSSSR